MIDALIRWSLGHRAIVVALAAAFLVWGGWTASRMPLDVLPDLTAPTVTILVEAPGMDPLEIESLVTFPIESALNGAAGVRRVRSATAVGVAVVWVEFDWGQDIERARQTVTEKLTLVSGSLPPRVEPPFLAPGLVDHGRGAVRRSRIRSAFAARSSAPWRRRSSRRPPAGRARRVAGDRDRRRAEAVRGGARSRAAGGLRRSRSTMSKRRSTAANRNATAGFQVAEGQEYLIRGVGRLDDTSTPSRRRGQG